MPGKLPHAWPMPNRRHRVRSNGVLAALALVAWPAPPAHAAVSVVVGPTAIVAGDARAERDITVSNEKLAFALAAQSPVPYGVPRGALIDLAPVSGDRIGHDRVVFADFIPNDWSAWPNTYQKIDIVERGPAQAVVRTVRDWGAVTITTTYTLRAGSDHIEIAVTMANGGNAVLKDLRSGLTLWPNSGFRFRVPGLAALEAGAADAALADRTVAYDAQWFIALHAPYLTHVAHGSRDLYQLHTLAPGESRSFEGWLQVGGSGDLAPVVGAEIERRQLAAGRVRGTVTGRDGRKLAQPVIVIEKSGQPYAWTLGTAGAYQLALPVGEYELYATARDHSQSGKVPLSVKADQTQTRDFRGLEAPGRVRFEISESGTSRALDARITISQGQQPLVEFLGRKTFFTELEPRGRLDLTIAPGRYTLAVSSGGGFTSAARSIDVSVASGGTQVVKLALAPQFFPAKRGWYAADLHHHADQAEAVTPPLYLARSQLAAGLDLLFVSDHDSLANLPALRAIARRRNVPFIAGVELSPSWGHFNAYPIAAGKTLAVDTSTAGVDALFAEARRLGASIVQVNHPLIPYGYFTSLAAGVAPGGFNPAFELVEINATETDTDEAVFHRMWEFWNAGHRYYLSAGTDTHDVWNVLSGRIRAYAHVKGTVTAAAFLDSLRSGHAYVSYGPLLYPGVDFGDTLLVKPGALFKLGFDLESVVGLSRAELIGGGVSAASRSFDGQPARSHVDFELSTAHATWYALVVEDAQGHKAFSNPIWVDPVELPLAPATAASHSR